MVAALAATLPVRSAGMGLADVDVRAAAGLRRPRRSIMRAEAPGRRDGCAVSSRGGIEPWEVDLAIDPRVLISPAVAGRAHCVSPPMAPGSFPARRRASTTSTAARSNRHHDDGETHGLGSTTDRFPTTAILCRQRRSVHCFAHSLTAFCWPPWARPTESGRWRCITAHRTLPLAPCFTPRAAAVAGAWDAPRVTAPAQPLRKRP